MPVKVIASDNGLEAVRLAHDLIQQGEDTLEAVVRGVTLVEDDPNDLTVGYGGLPNEAGDVEVDAAVMHGPTHRAGGVAALKNIKHAARLAMKVMETTDHSLLAGDGALEFARTLGFPEENLLTEKARKIWLHWKRIRSRNDSWQAPKSEEDVDPEVLEFFRKRKLNYAGEPISEQNRPTGTIHCAGINSASDLSCVTTTSGLAFKVPGRVGDSPLIGAGLYVDNEIGSCGSTGRGEANIRDVCSFAGVELMRHGMSPLEAGRELLQRICRHTTEPRLLDGEGRPNFGVRFYLLAKSGEHAAVSMWGPTKYAFADENGARIEQCDYLFERQDKKRTGEHTDGTR
ncbi:MAG: N(4)-(beta-N-acetylglucosaminyl)-L-asparaginase [Planctomycetaceae bacterium]|nr:N(4)-(beta-N-acetylglucosaminyl)-L-asparaginase [Planctomycetaceae bacterium]